MGQDMGQGWGPGMLGPGILGLAYTRPGVSEVSRRKGVGEQRGSETGKSKGRVGTAGPGRV